MWGTPPLKWNWNHFLNLQCVLTDSWGIILLGGVPCTRLLIWRICYTFWIMCYPHSLSFSFYSNLNGSWLTPVVLEREFFSVHLEDLHKHKNHYHEVITIWTSPNFHYVLGKKNKMQACSSTVTNTKISICNCIAQINRSNFN